MAGAHQANGTEARPDFSKGKFEFVPFFARHFVAKCYASVPRWQYVLHIALKSFLRHITMKIKEKLLQLFKFVCFMQEGEKV